jgi:hypothetical protein
VSIDWAPFGSEESDPDESTITGLCELLDAQANLLVSVATGGQRIDGVDAKYQRRHKKLNAALRKRGIAVPFAYDSLWDWYGDYSQNISGYAGRRAHIKGLADPVRAALDDLLSGIQVSDPGSPAEISWTSLGTRVQGIADEVRIAADKDDFQDVGRRCREVLIDLGKLLADPALVPSGEDVPKDADAKRWLEYYLAAHASGNGHRELRAFIPKAWDLAQKVTHGDIARVDAFAAAQATILVVRTLQQLAVQSLE